MKVKRVTPRQLLALLTFLMAILLTVNVLHAQETRGTIKGTVADPNKAAVPNATVKIIDTERGRTVTLTTNDDGFYQANYLLSGKYQIIVETTGFKRYVRDNVVLQISENLNIDVALEVGTAAETVNVTAQTPPLETSTASLGLVVDEKRIAELPLVHGDPYTLIGLSPGVSYTGSARLDRPFEPTHIVGFAVDGTRGNRSDLTIDGAPSTATANGNEVIATYVPPSDIVQEFKVQTATFDSQFGNTEGGVTSISIKSGTNSLKGSAYYFAEPGTWAANDFFGNARGQARPETKSDRFGGYVSGPVRLPWLYNGKDKTFFLFGYEGIRDSRPRFDAGQSVWVPTAKLAAGDFSDYNIVIWDPTSRILSGGNYTAQTNFGAAFNSKIPDARINPVAKAVLKDFAKPKGSGLNGNIFDSTLAETTNPYDNWTFRVDQNITDNNHLFVRGSWYDRTSIYNDYTASPYTGVNFFFNARQGVIDDVHTFNSTTFLNVRYGYSRFIREQDQEPDAQGISLKSLGFSDAYNNLIPESIRRYPRFDFGVALGNGMSNEFRPVTTHSGAAILNKIIGTHSMKFGGELRVYREDDVFKSNDQTGRFIFDNTYTRQASNTSSTDSLGLQGFAAFLLGLPTTMQIERRADYSEYSKTYGFFFQDDWKVNKRLTLNLGLRYELETPLVERNNKSVTGFDANYVQPIQTDVRNKLTAVPVAGYSPTNTAAPNIDPNSINVRGGLLFTKDTGSGLYETPKNTFLPRFGVAYQLTDKTVLRGGIGLFAGFLGERRGDVIQSGYSRTTINPLSTVGVDKAPIPFSIDSFPTITILEPVGDAQGKQTGLGGGISFFNQNPKVSKQMRYQIGVQRELAYGFVAEAVYVGNYGYDIEIGRNINALPNQYLNTDNNLLGNQTANNANLNTSLVANPFVGLSAVTGTGFANATFARSNLLRPFVGFGDINTTNNDGKSWYHSGQFSLQKRLSHGYTFGASYTWSKWLQATEYLNAGDAKPTKMISDQDTPHRFSMSALYQLPFGKGAFFASNAGAILDRIIGGWQLGGVYTFQTGFPVAFTNDLFYIGGDIAIDPKQRTTLRWFNTDAFLKVAPVSHLRTLPTRFSNVRRDNQNNVDLSLLKDIRIRETMKIQIKLDFINAFNEPYFVAPVVNPTSADFGKISASNQDNYARRAQFGIKFLF